MTLLCMVYRSSPSEPSSSHPKQAAAACNEVPLVRTQGAQSSTFPRHPGRPVPEVGSSAPTSVLPTEVAGTS